MREIDHIKAGVAELQVTCPLLILVNHGHNTINSSGDGSMGKPRNSLTGSPAHFHGARLYVATCQTPSGADLWPSLGGGHSFETRCYSLMPPVIKK